MSLENPQSFIGQTLLSRYSITSLAHSNDVLTTFSASSTLDSSVCTLRICSLVDVPFGKEALLDVAIGRIARHAVGIQTVCSPRAAGAVDSGFRKLLALVHDGPADESAQDRIESGAPLALSYLLRSLRPVAQALGALHDQGLVHGALQPAMFRLAPSGASLSGFGLSESASIIGGPSAVRDCIPLRYRAPEQSGLVASAPSQETDTYAFALLAAELLAGRPFTLELDPYVLAREIDDPDRRPTPRSLGVDVSDEIEQVFAAALRVNPRDRISDPRRFIDVIENPNSYRRPSVAPPLAADPPKAAVPNPDHASQPQENPIETAPRSPEPVPPSPPAAPKKSGDSPWLVYAFLGVGSLLLLGGVVIGFWYVMGGGASLATCPSVTSPSATSPVPTPAVPGPSDQPDASSDDSKADASSDQPDADFDTYAPDTATSARSDASNTLKLPSNKLPAGPKLFPDDLTALIPISPENIIIGNRSAFVTVVLFADLLCPYTRKARVSLDSLYQELDPDLRIVVKHLPLALHPKAFDAAELGASVNALSGSNAFWSFFGKVADNSQKLDDASILRWASEAGAKPSELEKAIKEHRYQKIVRDDLALAGALMVRATPTMFVNGRRVDGMPEAAALGALIDVELKAAKAVSKTIPQARLYSSRVHSNVTSGENDSR